MHAAALLSTALLLVACADSTGGADGDGTVDGVDVSLDDVGEGEARVVTSGAVTLDATGTAALYTTGTETIDGGAPFNVNNYVIAADAAEVFVDVHWPQADGETMPAGDYPIRAANLADFPNGRFVDLSVGADGESFGVPFGVDQAGMATLSGPTSEGAVDLVFSAAGLETFFDELVIDASGAVKVR